MRDEYNYKDVRIKPVQSNPFVILRCPDCYIKDGTTTPVEMKSTDNDEYSYEQSIVGTCTKCKTTIYVDLQVVTAYTLT